MQTFFIVFIVRFCVALIGFLTLWNFSRKGNALEEKTDVFSLSAGGNFCDA